MSLHPSLKIDSAGAKQRTVLTRIERIKDLMKKGLWTDDHAVTALPKTKIIKIKAAKSKKEDDEEEKDEKIEGETEQAATAEDAPATKEGGKK